MWYSLVVRDTQAVGSQVGGTRCTHRCLRLRVYGAYARCFTGVISKVLFFAFSLLRWWEEMRFLQEVSFSVGALMDVF